LYSSVGAVKCLIAGVLEGGDCRNADGFRVFSGDRKAILRGSDSGSDSGTGIDSVNGGLLYLGHVTLR
jgi:hypothetical protein